MSQGFNVLVSVLGGGLFIFSTFVVSCVINESGSFFSTVGAFISVAFFVSCVIKLSGLSSGPYGFSKLLSLPPLIDLIL